MISTLVQLQLIEQRERWDFASYNPGYEKALQLIKDSNWNYDTLSDLVDFFKYGASIPAEYTTEGIIFIRAQNIREYGIDLSDICYIADKTPNIDKYRLESGDILITRSGANVGNAAAIPENIAGSIHGSYSIRLRISTAKVSPNYLAVALNSSIIKTQILASKGRSAQPNINITELGDLQIPIPPPHIQEQIANEMQNAYSSQKNKLSEAEKLYQAIEHYVLKVLEIDIKKLKIQNRSIKSIRSIAGGRFDFEALVTLQEINFGLIKPVLLQEVVRQINQRITPVDEYANKNINYIGLSNIASNTGELVDFLPVQGEVILSSSPKFEVGDILFGRMRPYLNKVWLAEFDGICSGEALVFRLNKQKVDPVFLQALLLSQLTLNQVIPLQSGTTLPRVSASDVLSIKLPIPEDLNKQKEISAEISRRRAEAKKLRVEAEKLVMEAKARVERMILGEENVT